MISWPSTLRDLRGKKEKSPGTTSLRRLDPEHHAVCFIGERVSKKRKLLLYAKLSEALKHFEIAVSRQEEEAESELVQTVARAESTDPVLEVFHGPLKGVVGRLRSKAPSGRVGLDVDLLGQSVSVEVDGVDVRPLGK